MDAPAMIPKRRLYRAQGIDGSEARSLEGSMVDRTSRIVGLLGDGGAIDEEEEGVGDGVEEDICLGIFAGWGIWRGCGGEYV